MRDFSGRTLGEFILREQIGEGGFGTVYRAEQPLLERDVVIKVLHDRQRDKVSQRRFLREARLASRLDHPYAAHVYAFGAENTEGLLWIAMEFVQGVSLDGWLEAHGPMPPEQFVPFFECVTEVVHTAHERGIIHRDLKPSNIMVIERGGRLFPKLLDFGIAKVSPEAALPASASEPEGSAEHREPASVPDSDDVVTVQLLRQPPRVHRTVSYADSESRHRLTASGTGLGSQPYMAPEQWRNAGRVRPAADIYSLGVVAYQALSGHLPFTQDCTDDGHREPYHGPPPRRLWPEIDDVLQTALAESPGGRPKTALELAAALRKALPASRREQLRSSAQQWEDRGRPPGLLWGPDVLADVTRRFPLETLGKLECSFVAGGLRRARHTRWFWRTLVVLVAATALGAAVMRNRDAQQVAAATITQSELEQGRSALLHGEPEASVHLGRAYQRGDHSSSTAFMLARALQPRLAEQARFTSSFGRMWSAAFSPDGRQIVTTDDRGVQVRDAQTGRLRLTLPYGDTVYEAVYSADGTRLTAAGVGSVKIWDAASGTLVRELRSDGTRPRYYAVAISPDGKLVAAIDTQGDVAHIWDATTGELIAEIHNDASEFPAIAFSADGRWLATTGGDDVRVFDARTRTQAVTIRGSGIRSLAFDPTGPRLLTGAATGDVAIWSVQSGARIQHLRDVRDPVETVAFSPDGQLVAAGSDGGAVQVWRAGPGELQSQLNPRHSKILAVEFDRTSRLVLAADADGTVAIADAALGMPLTVLEGPQNVLVAHFDPSSHRVVSASLDGTARVWDATSPYRRWSSPPMSDGCGIVTAPEPDRRFIAVGCRGRATRVWDTARDQLLAELPSVTHVEGDFTSAFPAVSAAGDRAAIARGNTVEIYELPGGRLLHTIVHSAAVNAVAFAATGRDIVSGAVDGSLLVTRDGGARLAMPLSPGGIDAAAFLPDGRVIAADAQRRLRVYDPSGTVLADFEIPARVMSLRIDGTRLVTVPIAPPITANVTPPLLLDLERYRVIAQLEGHVGRVFSARWVAEHQILTTGADGAARLWDGSTGQLRKTFRGGSRLLADATLTSDGFVIAGGADGLLRFWDRTSGRLLWALQAHSSMIVGVHAEGGDIVTRGFTGEFSRWRLPSPAQVIGACNDHESCAMVQQ